jgi:hypothetical protein
MDQELVAKLCKKLEKLYGNDDLGKRPGLSSLRDDLAMVLDDKKVKIANRSEARAKGKALLRFYELEKGDPDKEGGATTGCGEVAIQDVQKAVQLYPEMFVIQPIGA